MTIAPTAPRLFVDEAERQQRIAEWSGKNGNAAFTAWLHSPVANNGRRFSARSRVVYAAMWTRFLEGTRYRGVHVTQGELENFLGAVWGKLRKGQTMAVAKKSPRQRERYLILIDQVMAHLMAIGVLSANPAARLLARGRVPHSAPTALTPTDAERLEDKLRNWPCGHWRDFRDRALLFLLLRTGVKVHECLQLRPTDLVLDGAAPHLNVRLADTPARAIPLDADAVAPLREWLEIRATLTPKPGDGDRLFVSSDRPDPDLAHPYPGLSAAQVYRLSKMAFVRAELSLAAAPQQGPQLLRNTFATRLLRNGVPVAEVSKRLGHAEITSTEVFARVIERQDAKAGAARATA